LSFAFRVAPRADSQIRAAVRWWTVNRTKAPSLLQDELDTAFGLIEELPYTGESVAHARVRHLRRLLPGDTQYHVYYIVSEEEASVEILALWHTSRGRGPRL
jgi:plasmid stabilization system protein ParE